MCNTSDNIMLSIITPFHNQDSGVFKRTADSVIEATGSISWEWVIIMHNTDKCTPSDIAAITGNRPNVRIFEKKDEWHSPSSPRNEGISRATGKYLYFLDDDDVCEKDFFRIAIDKMERDECDILIGRAENICDGDSLFSVPMPLIFPETEDGYIVPDDPDIKGNLLYGACTFLGTKLILRDIVEKNHIEFDRDIILTEDLLFELKCYIKAHKICVMSSLVSYTYIQRESSLLQRMMSDDSFDEEVYLEPLKRIVELALANNISPSAHVWNMMGMFGVIYTRGGMSKEKKNRLFSLSHKFIPTLNFDFPKWISDKRIRKEYLISSATGKQELKYRLKSLMDDYNIRVSRKEEGVIPLYYKDISNLDEKKQTAFMKGFWRVLEGDGYEVNTAAFALGKEKTMIQLSMDRKLFEDIGPDAIRRLWT